MPGINPEEISLETIAGKWMAEVQERQAALHTAQQGLRETLGLVRRVLEGNTGKVLPLKGIARSSAFRAGESPNSTVYVVTRNGDESGIPTFRPGHYRIGSVFDSAVMLTEASSGIEDNRVGLAADIGSLTLATEAEIRAVSLVAQSAQQHGA